MAFGRSNNPGEGSLEIVMPDLIEHPCVHGDVEEWHHEDGGAWAPASAWTTLTPDSSSIYPPS
jgi:hypothetical protein